LWGDSKELYRGGAGLDLLERGVLVALALATGSQPANWPALAAAVGLDHGDTPAVLATLGALGVPRQPLNLGRIAGVGLVLAGVLLVRRS
jgi:hypothetical protein